jgi:copper chaperone CopZ
MTKFPPFHVDSSNNLMQKSLFCEVVDEEDDGIDPEVLTTTMTTTTNNNTTIETQGGKESVPMRRRVTMLTARVRSTKAPTYTTPATATKSAPFFPKPPPMFAIGDNVVGAKSSASSPALLVDPSTGASFHPDFMFCGACTDCKENDGGASTSTPVLSGGEVYNNDNYESNSDSESNSTDSSDKNMKAFLRTTFQLGQLQQPQDFSNAPTQRQPQKEQHRHNEILVLRSLIRAIPGVRKVSIPIPHNTAQSSSAALYSENIVVTHDASVLTGIIQHAFESAGYSAFIRNTTETAVATTNNNDGDQSPCWVRSAFDVQGICCSSEVPAIRRIVKPLLGVAKVNINLTTKVVHVQHNYVQIQASQIAQSLTEQGVPAQITKDGAATVQFARNHRNNDNDEQLNIQSLADTLDRIGRSLFVESTLIVEGLRPDQVRWIEKAVADSFIRVQVRAVYPSAISETIKVEHNPDLVSIADIRDFLRRDTTNKRGPSRYPPTAEVYIDGADTNLYLPSEDDYPDQPVIHRDDGGCFSWIKRHHVNVVLSGVFWILSMVSIVGGM